MVASNAGRCPEGWLLTDLGRARRSHRRACEIADQFGHSKPSMAQDVYMGRTAVSPAAAAALPGVKPFERISGVKRGDDLRARMRDACDQVKQCHRPGSNPHWVDFLSVPLDICHVHPHSVLPAELTNVNGQCGRLFIVTCHPI
jgi:hypothetical protein